MNSRPLAAALPALLLVLAGCVSPAQPVDSLSTGLLTETPHLEIDDTHDHKDRAQHAAAWNAEYLGWDSGTDALEKIGHFNHVAAWGNLTFMSAYNLTNGTAGGLLVHDVSEGKPKLLATYETPDITPVDVTVTKDGKYVVLAGHRDRVLKAPDQSLVAECPPLPGNPLRACQQFVGQGVLVFDVSDPAAPKLVTRWRSIPSGTHAVKTFDHGGELHIYLASYGATGVEKMGTSVEILKFVPGGPTGGRLDFVTRWFPDVAARDDNRDPDTFVHDVWIEDHPIRGAPILYVSLWDGGVVFADVSKPSEPKQLGQWSEFEALLYGNIHFARPLGMIGAKHITLAQGEFTTAEHAGVLHVLDTTNPASPVQIGEWVLPGNPVNDHDNRFSPHYFDVRGTMIAYAHYHGGVWILDLADPTEPRVHAYFFPTAPELVDAGHRPRADDGPEIWAAQFTAAGTVVASDMGSGVYHYRIVSDAPGTPPYEATLAAE